MPGTQKGGLKARETIYKKHGNDFYKNIGAKGGKKLGVAKGFASNISLAREAGRKGGKNSRRGKSEELMQRVQLAKALRDGGMKIKDIAKQLDRTQLTIINYLKK